MSFAPARSYEKFLRRMSSHYSEKIKIGIAVDCHQSERMGMRGKLFEMAPVKIILDHHVHEGDLGELAPD